MINSRSLILNSSRQSLYFIDKILFNVPAGYAKVRSISMSMDSKKITLYFLRFSIALGFLSAVADRFGLYGAAGAPNVAWGNFEAFSNYTALLNPLMPKALIPVLAWGATIAEVVLGTALIIGFKVKEAALGSGVLLLIFGLSMMFAISVKAPFDYSVFAASAAAFALFFISKEKD